VRGRTPEARFQKTEESKRFGRAIAALLTNPSPVKWLGMK
jgi:hypothetical protein